MKDHVKFMAETRASDWVTEGTASAPGAILPAAVARSRAKRTLDLTVALIGLLMFLPLLCLIAMAVRTESPGPALFRQRRTGLGGQIFTVFKFRTMRVVEDGETIRQATRNDARITPLGAILRRLSLDELPQILNVIRGEMSLIGPRPHAIAHDEAWGQAVPNYSRRFRAKPGLTGFAVVCGHRGEVSDLKSIVDRVEADNAYIDSWSIWLDIEIAWRTIPLIFSDSNAY
jgi:putative colanic acid biosynthesis UDP-glucose lipid carrier transferase